jgi:hypothetical protein
VPRYRGGNKRISHPQRHSSKKPTPDSRRLSHSFGKSPVPLPFAVSPPLQLFQTITANLRNLCDELVIQEDSPLRQYKQWDALTARIADSATLAFLLLQLPQIVLNTQNLVSGNHVALTAIPWMVRSASFTRSLRLAIGFNPC